MRHLLLVLAVFSTISIAKTPLQIATEFEQGVKDDDTRGFQFIRENTDIVVNRIIGVAMAQLRLKGHPELAEQLSNGWAYNYKYSMFTEERNIGDHRPIIQWLATMYEQIEAVIGIDLARATHISDLKTINSGVLTVILKDGCDFPMNNVSGTHIDEYRRHFDGGRFGGDKYFGVIPVLVYWLTDIGCYSGGVSAPVCPLLAMVAENLMDIGGAYLSDAIYRRSCGNN